MDLNLIYVLLYAVLPILVYIGIGLYILSLEQKKGPGYKLPALIYFISVPSIILIVITLIKRSDFRNEKNFEEKKEPKKMELM